MIWVETGQQGKRITLEPDPEGPWVQVDYVAWRARPQDGKLERYVAHLTRCTNAPR